MHELQLKVHSYNMDGALSTSPVTTSAGGELGEGDLDCSVEDSTEVGGIEEFI